MFASIIFEFNKSLRLRAVVLYLALVLKHLQMSIHEMYFFEKRFKILGNFFLGSYQPYALYIFLDT